MRVLVWETDVEGHWVHSRVWHAGRQVIRSAHLLYLGQGRLLYNGGGGRIGGGTIPLECAPRNIFNGKSYGGLAQQPFRGPVTDSGLPVKPWHLKRGR